MKNSYLVLVLLLLSAASFTSCLKKDYDAPPDQSTNDPNLTVTKSIAQLLAMGIDNVQITTDEVIAGIVTGDDRSGNLYKQIFIDDSTAGIALLLDATSLYNDYPVGRKVYVKCKGLYIGNYHKLPQIGFTPDNTGSLINIPAGVIGDYVIKASYFHKPPVTVVTLADISTVNDALVNRLVMVSEAEFTPSYAGKPYAQPASITSATNVDVEDCSGNIVVLRSSGYANFQPFLTPTGKGTITALYTIYGTTPQLIIRDTTDVKFTGTRCNGSVLPILTKDFEPSGSVTDGGWTVQKVIGNFPWIGSNKFAQSGDWYGQCTGYDGANNNDCESWLISPSVDLSSSSSPVLEFINSTKYTGPAMEVYVSTNYDGTSAPSSASWTKLTFTASPGNFTWADSGPISLSGYKSNKVYIAFKYSGTSGGCATWEVDDITIKEN